MNITSSYDDNGYDDYYGSYIIDNSTNMFPSIHPSIHPSIIISTPPRRVILSIMTNSPTSIENISISEENNSLSKIRRKVMFGLVLGVALLGGMATSFVFHKIKTHLKNYQEEPIFTPDVIIVKEDEL